MDNRCKRFLHEPDWTPNNYDIYINPSEIPANIHVSDSSENLSKRNNFHISTELKLNKKKVKFK